MAKLTGYLLFFLPKIASSGSALGSCMVISQVLMSQKNRSNKQQRIVCAMSCIDVIVSSVWFFTNFFIPSSVEEFLWATGNGASCTVQGFIVQFSISSVIYNAALSYYYVLIIKHNYRDRQLEKIEKWFHLCPLAFGITTALSALVLRVYDFAVWDCWIAPPYGEDSGEEYRFARILQWCLFFGPLWIAIIFSSLNMLQIYWKVKRVELECTALNISRERQLMMVQNTKSVATQGRLYVAAFFVTWLFPTIARIIQVSGGTVPQWLIVCSGTFIPSQGIFNAMVYFRLRFIKCSQEHSDRSKLWVIRRIIQLTICPCLERGERYNVHDGRDVEPSFRSSVEGRLSRSSNSQSQASSGQRMSRLSEGWSGISFPSTDPSFVVSETSMSEVEDPESRPENVENAPEPPRRYYQRARQLCNNNSMNNNDTTVTDNNDLAEDVPDNNCNSQEQADSERGGEAPLLLFKSFISDLVTIDEGSDADEVESRQSRSSRSSRQSRTSRTSR